MDAWARPLFAVLCLATAVGFFVFPTYPNYDSYYSLLWGREVLDLTLPHFEGFRVPTEHPLAIAVGAVLSLFGEAGDRLWIAATLASYVALVAGVYRLGRIAFTPLVGLVAAALLLTRFDFAFLAARGYIDIPYMALVVWALVLEVQKPRRGAIVFGLLALSGMLRVEGWLLAAAYWVWMSWPGRATWGERVKWAAWAALGPVTWWTTDFIVTGNPLFSLQYTSNFAEDLGRSRSLSELPSVLPLFFSSLVKLPVLVVAIVGVGLALWITPRRAIAPLVLFLTGVGTFVAVAAGGASVIERYLVIGALALLIFAGVGFAGWTMLERGRARTIWMSLAIVAVLGGVAYTATHLNLRRFGNELSFRGDAHNSLAAVLRDPDVTRARRCGDLYFPNHKLVPDARWILDERFEDVKTRVEVEAPEKGVFVLATSRFAIFKHAFTNDNDPSIIQVPPEGWEPVARSVHYAAYAKC
jgi:hypothetical protein